MNTQAPAAHITIGNVAAALGITRSEAFRLRLAESWPHTRIGTEIRFTDADFTSILNGKRNQK